LNTTKSKQNYFNILGNYLKQTIMITVEIDETTRGGKRIIKTIQENLNCVNVKHPMIKLDENGRPIGRTLKEYDIALSKRLSELTGYDIKPTL
jgi:hypothetical protein